MGREKLDILLEWGRREEVADVLEAVEAELQADGFSEAVVGAEMLKLTCI